jgi:ABC-type transport system involved in cytochrome bd biosynthesis fused ATPase/permease subunit
MTIALFDTMSRIGIAVAIAGVGWQLVRLAHTDRLKRLVAVIAIGVVAVIATPIGRQVIDAANSTSGQTRTAQSAQYRLRVLDVLQDPKEYSILGHPNAAAESVSAAARSETGLKSLDSEYAVALITGGVIALVALLGLGLTLLYGAVSPAETDPNVRGALTATAAVMGGLAVVALLTQFADIFGILIALLASQRQRRTEATGVER